MRSVFRKEGEYPKDNSSESGVFEATRWPDLLTEKQLASYLQITSRAAANWRKDGTLPYFRIRRSIRYRRADIDRWLNDKCQRGLPM